VTCWDALLCALRKNLAILCVDPAKKERLAALFAPWVERAGAAVSTEEHAIEHLSLLLFLLRFNKAMVKTDWAQQLRYLLLSHN
jgi:hypothetical protein